MVVHKNNRSTSEKLGRSDQDRIDVKIDFNGEVSISFSEKATYVIFRSQGEIKRRVRWLTLKGGEPITGAK